LIAPSHRQMPNRPYNHAKSIITADWIEFR
jgi:hypothetical protein